MSATARVPMPQPAPQGSWMRRVHVLLAVQSLVVILVSINRLTSLANGYVAANEFLRWVDLNNMLVLPLASLVAFYLLKQELPYESPARGRAAHRSLGLLFVVGVYLLGAGYGDHEVTNYLHARVCTPDDGSALCRILIFNDDEFSHWVFFAGFILMNAALLGLQALFPRSGDAAARDTALLALNGLFIGLGVFANLAFEEIGLDLYVVAVLALLSLALLARRGRQPLFVYYAVAYVFGLCATGIYKLVAA